MSMTISMKREALLAKLAEQLEVAKREDAKVAAKHEKEEQAALVDFRERCRAALNMDWKTIKAKDDRQYNFMRPKFPNCPRLKSAEIQGVINMVALDTRRAPFRIKEDSDLHRAITWVPDSKKHPQTVCG